MAFYLGTPQLEDFGTFDFAAYTQSLADNARQAYTPEQWLMVVNDSKARLALNSYRLQLEEQLGQPIEDLEDKELQNNILVELNQRKLFLVEEYPGYTGGEYNTAPPGVPQRASVTIQVGELKRLVDDNPQWAVSPPDEDSDSVHRVVYAAAAYMKLKDHADGMAHAEGFISGVGKTGEGKPEHVNYQRREILRREAARLITTYPEFGPVWQNIFGRELVDDAGIEMTVEDAYIMMGATYDQ